MEERFASGGSGKTIQAADVKDVTVKEPTNSKAKDAGFAFPKKPKTLRIAKVEPAQQESKLPKVVKGLTIKEVLPATIDADLKNYNKVSESEETSKIENEPANATEFDESVKDESKTDKDDTKQIVSTLPGVKITLNEAINELDQLAFQEPSLE